MKRKLYPCFFAIGAFLIFTGCGNRQGASSFQEADESIFSQMGTEEITTDEAAEAIAEAETTREIQTAQETEATREPETTEPETVSPFDQYTYGMKGLEIYNAEEPTGGQAGEVYLAAYLAGDAMVEEGYFSLDGLFIMPDSRALICYSISDQVQNFFAGDGDAKDREEIKCTQYLASYDFKTGTVLKKIALHSEGAASSYVEQISTGVWYWELVEENVYGTFYDLDLNEKANMTKTINENGYFSEDGEDYYFARDNRLWKRKLADGILSEEQEIVLSQEYAVSYLSGIFTDADGVDYAITGGIAADLRNYMGIVNLNTGAFAYLQDTNEWTIYVDKGGFVARAPWNELTTTYYIVYPGEPLYSYTWSETEYINVALLSDGNALFYDYSFDEAGAKMHIELYGGAQKELLGSTAFDIPSGDMWFGAAPYISEEEDMLVLPMTDMSGDTYFYYWDYEQSDTASARITVAEEDIPSEAVAQIEYKWDPAALVPGECPEEFAELRARADVLEEQYGINIYIADECGGIFGGYGIVPVSDYAVAESALNTLACELEKYPDGFFQQFRNDWIEGIDIYLAGLLIGADSGTLDYAGGFQTEYNGKYALVIDSSYPDSLMMTFHHELSHAIDQKMLGMSDEQHVYLDEEYWNTMNPRADVYGSSYTYMYEEFGRPELFSFAYDGTNAADAYFIDTYSMTFPTEDRARLFEYIMTDNGWVDWENAPHLREKLNYYASCIRAAFDTTGWDEVAWEAYQSEGQ